MFNQLIPKRLSPLGLPAITPALLGSTVLKYPLFAFILTKNILNLGLYHENSELPSFHLVTCYLKGEKHKQISSL